MLLLLYYLFSLFLTCSLIYGYLNFQPLIGSVKEKLSQFCHVPVCFHHNKLEKYHCIHIMLLFTLYLVLFRLRIYLTSTMFQIYGMFPLFLEWVSTFSLRLSVDRLEETIEFVWTVFSHCSCTRFLTCAVFQNQKAHEAIIKQLNLSRWVWQLLKIHTYGCSEKNML
jgi:hypothetical protein